MSRLANIMHSVVPQRELHRKAILQHHINHQIGIPTCRGSVSPMLYMQPSHEKSFTLLHASIFSVLTASVVRIRQ